MEDDELMTCPTCGKDVPEGTKFCVFCGARLAGATPATVESEQTPGESAAPVGAVIAVEELGSQGDTVISPSVGETPAPEPPPLPPPPPSEALPPPPALPPGWTPPASADPLPPPPPPSVDLPPAPGSGAAVEEQVEVAPIESVPVEVAAGATGVGHPPPVAAPAVPDGSIMAILTHQPPSNGSAPSPPPPLPEVAEVVDDLPSSPTLETIAEKPQGEVDAEGLEALLAAETESLVPPVQEPLVPPVDDEVMALAAHDELPNEPKRIDPLREVPGDATPAAVVLDEADLALSPIAALPEDIEEPELTEPELAEQAAAPELPPPPPPAVPEAQVIAEPAVPTQRAAPVEAPPMAPGSIMANLTAAPVAGAAPESMASLAPEPAPEPEPEPEPEQGQEQEPASEALQESGARAPKVIITNPRPQQSDGPSGDAVTLPTMRPTSELEVRDDAAALPALEPIGEPDNPWSAPSEPSLPAAFTLGTVAAPEAVPEEPPQPPPPPPMPPGLTTAPVASQAEPPSPPPPPGEASVVRLSPSVTEPPPQADLTAPPELETAAGVIDATGIGARLALMPEQSQRLGQVAAAILSGLLDDGEVVEAMVVGQYQSNAAVAAMTASRVIVVNDRQWRPDVRIMTIRPGLLVQGWMDEHTAALVFEYEGFSRTIQLIATQELAREFAFALRHKVAAATPT